MSVATIGTVSGISSGTILFTPVGDFTGKVQVEVDGNKAADMKIVLLGRNLGLTAADCVL